MIDKFSCSDQVFPLQRICNNSLGNTHISLWFCFVVGRPLLSLSAPFSIGLLRLESFGLESSRVHQCRRSCRWRRGQTGTEDAEMLTADQPCSEDYSRQCLELWRAERVISFRASRIKREGLNAALQQSNVHNGAGFNLQLEKWDEQPCVHFDFNSVLTFTHWN